MATKEATPKTGSVTFWAPKNDGYQFFMNDRAAVLFHTAGGHERWKRHEKSVLKFKPMGDGSGGFYTTSDPEEIEALRKCGDVMEMPADGR